MDSEFLTFLGFGALQVGFMFTEKLKKRCSVFRHAERFHWAVWLGHPVVVHTIKDYSIHFVIYSGRIISGH